MSDMVPQVAEREDSRDHHYRERCDIKSSFSRYSVHRSGIVDTHCGVDA
jgi:hypothetical protein